MSTTATHPSLTSVPDLIGTDEARIDGRSQSLRASASIPPTSPAKGCCGRRSSPRRMRTRGSWRSTRARRGRCPACARSSPATTSASATSAYMLNDWPVLALGERHTSSASASPPSPPTRGRPPKPRRPRSTSSTRSLPAQPRSRSARSRPARRAFIPKRSQRYLRVHRQASAPPHPNMQGYDVRGEGRSRGRARVAPNASSSTPSARRAIMPGTSSRARRWSGSTRRQRARASRPTRARSGCAR